MPVLTLSQIIGPSFSSPDAVVEHVADMINENNVTIEARPLNWMDTHINEFTSHISDPNYLGLVMALLMGKKRFEEKYERNELLSIINTQFTEENAQHYFGEIIDWYKNSFLAAIYEILFNLDNNNLFGVDKITSRLNQVFSHKFNKTLTLEETTEILTEDYENLLTQSIAYSLQEHSLVDLDSLNFLIEIITYISKQVKKESNPLLLHILEQKEAITSSMLPLTTPQEAIFKQTTQLFWKKRKLLTEEDQQALREKINSPNPVIANNRSPIQPVHLVHRPIYLQPAFSRPAKVTLSEVKAPFSFKQQASDTISSAYNAWFKKVTHLMVDEGSRRKLTVQQQVLSYFSLIKKPLQEQEKTWIKKAINKKEAALLALAKKEQQQLIRSLNEFSKQQKILVWIDPKTQEVTLDVPELNDPKTHAIFLMTVKIADTIAGKKNVYSANRPLLTQEKMRLYEHIKNMTAPYGHNVEAFKDTSWTIFLQKIHHFAQQPTDIFQTTTQRLPWYTHVKKTLERKSNDLLALVPAAKQIFHP